MSGKRKTDSPAEETPDGENIRRPPNAFMVFAMDYRKSVAEQHPNINNKEISSILGKIWKNSSEAVKNQYHEKAAKLRDLHKAKYPDYVYCPRDARKKKMERMQKKAKDAAKARSSKSSDGNFKDEKFTGAGASTRNNKEGWKTSLEKIEAPPSPGYVPNNPELFPEYRGDDRCGETATRIPDSPLTSHQQNASWDTKPLKQSAFGADSCHFTIPGHSQDPSSWEPRHTSYEKTSPEMGSEMGSQPMSNCPSGASCQEFCSRYTSPGSAGSSDDQFFPDRFPYFPYPFMPPLYNASRPFPIGPPYPASMLQNFGPFPPPFWGPRPRLSEPQGLWCDGKPFLPFSNQGPRPGFYPQHFGFYQDAMKGCAFPSTCGNYGGYPEESPDGDRPNKRGYQGAMPMEKEGGRDKPGGSTKESSSMQEKSAEQHLDAARCYPRKRTWEDSFGIQDHQDKSYSEDRAGDGAYAAGRTVEDRIIEQASAARSMKGSAGTSEYRSWSSNEDIPKNNRRGSYFTKGVNENKVRDFKPKPEEPLKGEMSLEPDSEVQKVIEYLEATAPSKDQRAKQSKPEAWDQTKRRAQIVRERYFNQPKKFVCLDRDSFPLDDFASQPPMSGISDKSKNGRLATGESPKPENIYMPGRNAMDTKTLFESPDPGSLNPRDDTRREPESRKAKTTDLQLNQPKPNSFRGLNSVPPGVFTSSQRQTENRVLGSPRTKVSPPEKKICLGESGPRGSSLQPHIQVAYQAARPMPGTYGNRLDHNNLNSPFIKKPCPTLDPRARSQAPKTRE